ncbi:Glycoside Hydrolase Family 36 protein [Glomus cerebriforme]|uniref:Glycoside Hydrolase Family 36 protein n=1 Tax=Glomus cerebriforme TaxID=658196 RepID=A0A397T3C6_9GLOM|nr:Glycoside Hydrolase Family 36 protein [Glomus cerebriforme]
MEAYVQPSLLSTTYIHRNEVLTFKFYILSAEEYSPLHTLNVQLWSNINDNKWSGINFIENIEENLVGCKEIKYRIFELNVDSGSVKEGRYEFTIRVHSSAWSDDGEWRWLSEDLNKNGKIFIGPSKEIPSTSGTEKGIDSIFNKDTFNRIETIQTSKNIDNWCATMNITSIKGNFIYKNLGIPKNLVRYFGLERLTNWWLIPTSGSEKLNITSKDVQYLIIQQTSGDYISLIPLTNEKYTSALKSDDDGNLVVKCAFNNNECDKNVEVKLIISKGRELNDVIENCMNAIKKVIFQDEPKQDIVNTICVSNNGIVYYDKLGYCTWNAFYDKVRAEDLLQALNSLHNIGIQVGYVILDDGWQKVDNHRRIQGFEADLGKFPFGLKGIVDQVKKEFPYIEHFGVWHTLWGYWNGVDPSIFSDRYDVRKTTYNSPNGTLVAHIISPQDIHRFYDDFYSYLKEQGIDMVKVDFQSCFDDVENYEHKWWWVDYQKALNASINKYFNQKLIYCMANSPSIIQNILSNKKILSGEHMPLYRNSDDYYPDIEESHSWHIYTNAMNNLFTSHLNCIPDWDMCQSYHEYGEYHAAARAISGSPMYFTDIPNHHNKDIMEKCLVKTPKKIMQLLRCEKSAIPSGNIDDLFIDLTKVDKLLKFTNQNGRINVLGLWNCRNKNLIDHINISESFSFHKERGNVNKELVMYFVMNKELTLFKQSINVLIKKKSFEIILFIPVDTLNIDNYYLKMTCIGLINKYNGSKAILSNELKKISNNKVIYNVELVGYGECGFYLCCDEKNICNIKATLDDEEVVKENIKYEKEKELLIVKLEDNSGRVNGKESIKLSIEVNLDK